MREVILYAGGILSAVALIPYIVAILMKKVKPSKAAWIVFTVVDGFTIYGMNLDGKVNPQIVASGICALVIMILSFRYGTPGWTKTEKFSICSAAIGFLLLLKTEDPVLGIIVLQVTAFIGALPVFISAWQGKEDKFTWSLFFASCLLTVPFLKEHTFTSLIQPINFTVIGLIIVVFMYFKKHK